MILLFENSPTKILQHIKTVYQQQQNNNRQQQQKHLIIYY